MHKTVQLENGNIIIDLDDLFNSMDAEEQKLFIKSFAIESNVIDHVVDYICGENPDGWWSGCADDRRMKILTRVENAQIKKWSRYNWEFIKEATQRLKEIKEKKHIYWALYHGIIDDDLSMRISKFFSANNIVSNYTTEKAEQEISEVVEIVKAALKKLETTQPSEDV